MLRTTLILLAACIVPLCHAQRDSSLTQEFSKLNAKERSRIAAREQEESSRDAEFIGLMEQGEVLFRNRRYEDALEHFKLARTRRPYNVHPKVKIQDLEALIAKRDREEAAVEPPPVSELQMADFSPTLPEKVAVQVPAPVPPVHIPPPVVLPVSVQARSEELPEASATPRSPSGARRSAPPATQEKIPPIPGERIYKEGRSVIIERVVPHEGRAVTYRKVIQPWGDVHYFNDGVPMTVDGWSLVFGDQ